MYSWGVNASSPCSFSRMPRSFTMPFCLCVNEGSRSDRARQWAASDPRRVTFARKTGAERRAAREPRSRAYRWVSRGRACMKSHPSSRLMTLRSFIIPDAARRGPRCVDEVRVGTLARHAAGAGEISGSDAVTSSLETLYLEPGARNAGNTERTGRSPNQRAATTRALLHSCAVSGRGREFE